LPFRGESSGVIFNAILERAPVSAIRINPDVSPKLEEIIDKCLEKDRNLRYQHASDIRTDLQRLSRDTQSGRRGLVSAQTAVSRPGDGTLLNVVKQKKWSLATALVLLGLIVVTVVLYIHRSPPATVSRAKITHKQFTFMGRAYEPAISPDGMFVAYVSKKPGEEQKLMVQGADGSTLELARGGDKDIYSPRWSPNGSELLFSKYDETVKGWEIFVVSRLGGVIHPIATGTYGCFLAPDGSQIVTASQSNGSGFKGITLKNRVTGETKQVHLRDYDFLVDIDCFADTGWILAVTKSAEKLRIITIKPDGGLERTVVESNEPIFAARWSPTGDAIYYLHGSGSTQELSRISIRDPHAAPAVVEDGLQTGYFFTISNDGSRLAYTRLDQYSNLWRVKWQGLGTVKPKTMPVTSGTSFYDDAGFSPDGKWLCFIHGSSIMETNIFKMSTANGELVQLTYFEHTMTFSPAWSPDGWRIAFISNQGGASRVWTMRADGSRARALEKTNASGSNNQLAWWPSNDIVYQQSGVRNFLRITDTTHEEKRVLHTDPSVGWVPRKPVFSPDGKKLAVFWNRENRGVWIVSFEPYSETLLLSGMDYPIGWSPDGRYVYAVRRPRQIIRIQVATPRQLTSVATMPGDVIDGSVSPDGQEIIVGLIEEKSDVWLMDNFDPAARTTKTR